VTTEIDAQAEHATLFGVTAHQITAAAVQFAFEVRGTFSPSDIGRMHVAAGVQLVATSEGRDGAVAVLRSLADALERGDDQRKHN